MLSGPAAAPVWMCPECGHGSAELRDERAHLDAHRQLRAFFQEWESGSTPEPVGDGRAGRRRVLVAAVAAVLVLLLSVSVFSRINRTPDAFRDTVPETVLPGAEPQPVTGVVTPGPTARPADPSPAGAAPTARPAAPLRGVSAPVSDQVVPPQVSSIPAPGPAATVPPPGRSSGESVSPSAPSHLLSACVLGICLHVL